MFHRAFIVAGSIWVAGVAATVAQAGQEGHGGNILASEFVAKAVQVVEHLESSGDLAERAIGMSGCPLSPCYSRSSTEFFKEIPRPDESGLIDSPVYGGRGAL